MGFLFVRKWREISYIWWFWIQWSKFLIFSIAGRELVLKFRNKLIKDSKKSLRDLNTNIFYFNSRNLDQVGRSLNSSLFHDTCSQLKLVSLFLLIWKRKLTYALKMIFRQHFLFSAFFVNQDFYLTHQKSVYNKFLYCDM